MAFNIKNYCDRRVTEDVEASKGYSIPREDTQGKTNLERGAPT